MKALNAHPLPNRDLEVPDDAAPIEKLSVLEQPDRVVRLLVPTLLLVTAKGPGLLGSPSRMATPLFSAPLRKVLVRLARPPP